MNAAIARRIVAQTALLAAPLPLIWLSAGPLRVVAWIGLATWIGIIVRRGAPSTVRISIGVAVVANAIYFSALPPGRIWSYLIAGITLFLLWSAYQEEGERRQLSTPSKTNRDSPRPEMGAAFRELSSALEGNTDLVGRQAPERLAAFVLASTCRLLARIADHQSLTTEEWATAAVEFRHHLDSMWWLHLLRQNQDEHDIARLFPLVAAALSTIGEDTALPRSVRAPLTAIVDRTRVTGESIRQAYSAYVLDEVPAETRELIGGERPIDQRWRHALLMMLWLEERVPALGGSKPVTLGLIEESLTCWDSPLLTGFDFAACPIIELPQSFLE